MDGYEVAQRLRKQEGLEKAHVVAITGHATLEDAVHPEGAGFNELLAKPLDIDALHAVLSHRP